MRLNELQLKAIKESVSNNLKDYKLYLFGSRTDDKASGGDIDIMILTKEKFGIRTKLKIKREILNVIGEQKLDIVNFTFDEDNNFKNLIIEDAILL